MIFKLKAIAAITILTVILSGCGLFGPKDSIYVINTQIKDFNFINQNGENFGLKDLKGKVWVADFIFTNCETVCPPMTANMEKLQRMLKEEGIEAQLVSFSVDPEIDKPEVLKSFSQNYEADLSSWHFLTGYSQKEIEKFAFDNFGALVLKTKGEDQVTHGTSFYLVDKNGIIVKSYSGNAKTPFEEIINDIKSINK